MQEKNISKITINRELSWLSFNHRVLELANNKDIPLAEKIKFSAIYESNLDEFFMVRVGSLHDRALLKVSQRENKTGMTPKEQLDEILPSVRKMQKKVDSYSQALQSELTKINYIKVDFKKLSKKQDQFWKKYFISELLPVLSPQIVNLRHPFPFLKNLNTYIGAVLKGKNDKISFGIIPVNFKNDRVVYINEGIYTYFALVEEIILKYIDEVFDTIEITDKCLFRITRNADLELDEAMFDHDIDYRKIMGKLLEKRRKLVPVRLQLLGFKHKEIKTYLCEKLQISESCCTEQETELDKSYLWNVRGKISKEGLPNLFYSTFNPIKAPNNFSLEKACNKQDVLLSYPYQSFKPFINLLNEAAYDKDVVSIKMTLYRVANDSKIIEALINAAENGKEVLVIVELRARFDEQNNIDWSKELEKSGCTVIYGYTNYKVHSKLLLITKKINNNFEYISQIGTGNFNEKTAEMYTDLALFTSDKEVGEEINNVFANLLLEKITDSVKNLIVAPLCFKTVLMEEIDREILAIKNGGEARVIIKCNSISDKDIIKKISEASCAGVHTDMIIRGICCMKAGVEGLTDNVQVRSVVGRYLEHSRIYVFGTGDNTRVYIASGDFLTRNTERRLEVGIKIKDKSIAEKLLYMLKLQLEDNTNSSVMDFNGNYTKIIRKESEKIVDSQTELYDYLNNDFNNYVQNYEINNKKSNKRNIFVLFNKIFKKSK